MCDPFKFPAEGLKVVSIHECLTRFRVTVWLGKLYGYMSIYIFVLFLVSVMSLLSTISSDALFSFCCWTGGCKLQVAAQVARSFLFT